ncbi:MULTISPECIES: biotin synthase BioB [Phaeodactylibacter]|jgi:biotin synthase|uniref:Biotin synthase n=1 Tax=Phaeodactylibacter xiamenensis TaxID=1524460 RepID=A0A098S240_9BACT|nr:MULTISPECIES: biotin synthase BioB [Phaeodactylibacter]KGE86414.1 biotin synthase [Phaeodactylibacter xiamenensis]MCI5091031.1 biotin synthase BioB [Phaeodactylibacter sp.]MCR9054527.1 biotin synthase BioB [bacterium]
MEERKEWTLAEILEVHRKPLLELVYEAATVHRKHHNPNEVQISSLLSIKTGGCQEDCGYCPQAARYHTDIEENDLMSVEQVTTAANRAKVLGASRVCMGAAWRNVKDDEDFDQVIRLVQTVNSMDMEVCATLGMVTETQAKKLAEAGLYAYNHNLDTSEDYYKEVISTRGYEDRLETLSNVRKAKLTVCSGGIIGMGESVEDRCKMLLTLSQLDPQPESVPINALVAVEGTPMEDQEPVPIWDMVRMVATARIVMPKSTVRLSAGRLSMTKEGQALCFMAGAGSIFAGDKLLTTPNPATNEDLEMFEILGLQPTAPFAKGDRPQPEPLTEEERAKKENPKWSRPGHRIPAHVEYTKKGKLKKKAIQK